MSTTNELQTVEQVDLARYQGTWYEIARLPLRWEKQCFSNVTATYVLRSDGKMDVINRCREADGSESVSRGTATRAMKAGPDSKLKVTFFWPFAGDYWIIGLDPEYRWAVVGTPDRRFLWILSRTPRIEGELTEQLLTSARKQGFDTGELIRARQDELAR